MTTTTVEYVYFETPPFVDRTRYVTGVAEATTEVADEYAGLPAPFLDALYGLLKQQDSARCARCVDEPIGFVLHQNNMGFERLVWTVTGLARKVREGERTHVVALCGFCTPYVPEPDVPQAGV